MNDSATFRALLLSVVKHDYIAHAVDAHPRFKIVGVADQPSQPDWVDERNQIAANQFGVPYVRGVADAIAKFRPDVAVVSSQAERHCELAIAGAKAGLHVIVDKPMSPDLRQCNRFVDVVERTGVRTLVWNRNCLPALRQAAKKVNQGQLGSLRAIHCDFYFSKDAGPRKGSRKPGQPPINWLDRQIEAHADGSDGGVGIHPMGELQVEGIYPLAYLRLFSTSKITHVFARATAHFHQAHADNDVDDLATVTLHMEDGTIGSLCLGRIGAASHPDLGEIKLHLIGSDGSLVIDEPKPEVALYYRDQPATEFKHQRLANENDFLLVDNFAHAIDTGGDTVLDARGGRDICAIVQACLRSVQTHQLEAVEFRDE